MSQHLVTVIVMRSGVPEEVHIVSGLTKEQAGDNAESKFRDLIEKYAYSRSLDEDETEVAIANGYIDLPSTEYEIFLVWPEVEK